MTLTPGTFQTQLYRPKRAPYFSKLLACLYAPFYNNGFWINFGCLCLLLQESTALEFPQKTDKGSLTEGDGLVQLTSLF